MLIRYQPPSYRILIWTEAGGGAGARAGTCPTLDTSTQLSRFRWCWRFLILTVIFVIFNSLNPSSSHTVSLGYFRSNRLPVNQPIKRTAGRVSLLPLSVSHAVPNACGAVRYTGTHVMTSPLQWWWHYNKWSDWPLKIVANSIGWMRTRRNGADGYNSDANVSLRACG